MSKSFRASLTLRIFLLTSALLIAVSAVTYGLIAYLTPLSYTAILEGDLRERVEALVEQLEAVTPEESGALLSDFVRETGADIRVTDGTGKVLFSTEPVEDDGTVSEQEAIAESVQEDIFVTQQQVVTYSGGEDASAEGGDMPPTEVDGTSVDTAIEGLVIAQTPDAYSFAFADGTRATLAAQGGMRAVNQAAEALSGILPYLGAAILLISLAASFFYARFITRPIVAMRDIAKRMSTLDFDARWEGHRSDEIGDLGQSLNALSDNLSQALTSLSDANRQLQSDIDREREIERQRMAFFSAASHELKTPITILKGQLSGMLAQVGIYQDREKYLARALAVTGRMESLVKEILTINRIETAGFALKAEAVDLSALVQKKLDLDAELIEQKELALVVDIEPGVTVRGDEALLKSAVDNVLINAILYSPSGATVYVKVAGGVFSVENTGVFIEEEALGQLFTPFYRVEQSRNRKSGGSGLGLYLVKSILGQHGAACGMRNTERGVLFFSVFPGGDVKA